MRYAERPPRDHLNPGTFEHDEPCAIIFDSDRDVLSFLGKHPTDALAPFNYTERTWRTQKLDAPGRRKFIFIEEPIGVHVHEPQSTLVFRDEGIGGRSNGLLDAQSLRNALGHGGLAGSEISSEGENAPRGSAGTYSPADGAGSSDSPAGQYDHRNHSPFGGFA